MDGECGPAAAGTDPRDDCDVDPASTCLQDGECDGAGDCRLYAAGTACGQTSCNGDTITGLVCNGNGLCSDDTVSCSPYACNGDVCATSCRGPVDCSADALCVAGTCVPKSANGQPCSTPEECLSGICVDGFCCNAACGGQCEACDVMGAEGTCVAVSGAPHGNRPPCAEGTPAEPCQAATCDGAERTFCAGFVGPSVACREASCTDGVATLAEGCDGMGSCPPPTTKKCEPFACGESECKDQCASDADCAPGYRCDQSTSKCTAGVTCDGDHTLTLADGSTQDCSPYRCTPEGTCRETCASTLECVAGSACGADGTCAPVAPLDGATGDGGCACRAGRGSGVGWHAAATLLLLGACAARRQRRLVAGGSIRP